MDSAGASLWDLTDPVRAHPGRFPKDARAHIAIRDMFGATCLDVEPETFRGKSVLIDTSSQLLAGLATLELDGVSRRMVLCAAGLSPLHVQSVLRDARIDIIPSDVAPMPAADGLPSVRCSVGLRVSDGGTRRSSCTEWVLLTSGATGTPKRVVHAPASVTRLPEAAEPGLAGVERVL